MSSSAEMLVPCLGADGVADAMSHVIFTSLEVSDHRGPNSQVIDLEGVEIHPVFTAKIENTVKSST
jgi:hypothetical protein